MIIDIFFEKINGILNSFVVVFIIVFYPFLLLLKIFLSGEVHNEAIVFTAISVEKK